MQHVCAWVEAEDARFEVCGDGACEMWRWAPAYSEAAANEACRKVLPSERVAG